MPIDFSKFQKKVPEKEISPGIQDKKIIPGENDQKVSLASDKKIIELKSNFTVEKLPEEKKKPQMIQDVKIFGRTIPLDKVREIARKTLENSRNMIKGIKYYLSSWESRYKRYLIIKPNNFLIDEFESMQKTLDLLKEMKEFNEKLKN